MKYAQRVSVIHAALCQQRYMTLNLQPPAYAHFSRPNTPLKPKQSVHDVFDFAVLHAQFGAAADSMLDELIPLFFTDSQAFIARLRTALVTREANKVAQVAHGLRGASSVIGATACVALCHRLEDAAQAHDFVRASFLADAISAELTRLKRAC